MLYRSAALGVPLPAAARPTGTAIDAATTAAEMPMIVFLGFLPPGDAACAAAAFGARCLMYDYPFDSGVPGIFVNHRRFRETLPVSPIGNWSPEVSVKSPYVAKI